MTRILVVDDDEIVCSSVCDLLRDEGYEVFGAGDGATALSLLEQDMRIDVLLSDIHMPNLDGLTLLRHVRAKYPDIVVVLLTGESAVQIAVEAMRQGAAHYLLKPFDGDQLSASMREAAALRQANHQKKLLMNMLYSGLQNLETIDPTLRPPQPENTTPPQRDTTIPETLHEPQEIRIGTLQLVPDQAAAFCRGTRLDLTRTEFDLLLYTIQAGRRVVTLEELVLHLQGVHVPRNEARRMLSSHLSNLNAKLQLVDCDVRLANQWGRGYILESGTDQ